MKSFNVIILCVFFGFSFSANAQSKDKVQKETSLNLKKKKVERVQVTGSRIRRTDFEGSSPMKLIDRKSLEESPYNSASDYLRELTINSAGSQREQSGLVSGSTATVNLRGLGASNTLVLVNGSRLAPDGVSGAVDLNSIPEIAIEGVEILKDGASALYGSDALGGVVSFKTRKNFTGNEISLRTTVTENEGGSRVDLSAITGVQRKNSSITAAVQYRQNEQVFDRDRVFSRPGIFTSADGSRAFLGFSGTGPVPGYIDQNGQWAFVQGSCEAANAEFGTEVDGGLCRFPFANHSTTLPEVQQLSGYTNYEWTPTSRDTVSTTAFYSQRETTGIFAPTPGNDFTIPANIAGTSVNGGPIPNTTPGEDVTTRYRVVDLGNRITDHEDIGLNINSVYNREFADTWAWGTTVGYSRNRRFTNSTSGYAVLDPLNQGLADGSINFFEPGSSVDGFEGAAYEPWQKTTSTNVSVDTNIAGEVMDFGGSAISMAAGVQYNYMTYNDRVDPFTAADQVFGSAGTSGSGDRDIVSGYSEISIPFGNFEAQVAARLDSYSDFGTAFSPKIAAKWRPNKKFLVRASVGEGFRAPILNQLYKSQVISNPFVTDAVGCAKQREIGGSTPACDPQQYQQISGGNRDLDPEESLTYGIGALFEPVRGFIIGADFWHIDQSNVIGTANLDELTAAELNDRGLPSSLGISINRDENSDEILSIVNPLVNLSEREITGVDLQFKTIIPTPVGRFVLSDEHSVMVRFRRSAFPGADPQNTLDQDLFGRPKWRNTLSLSFSPNRSNTLGLTYNSTAGVRKIPLGDGSSNGRLSSYGEVDFAYTTRLPWKGQLTAGVKNITGKTPPFDPRNGLNNSIFQQIGRYGFLNYRQSF